MNESNALSGCQGCVIVGIDMYQLVSIVQFKGNKRSP